MSIDLKVPEVGESVTEVYIGEWLKSEGDQVEEGDALVELESEKATFELPAPKSGTLSKILKSSGEEAQVGEVIGQFEEAESQTSKKEESSENKKTDSEPKANKEKASKDDRDVEKHQPIPMAETKPRVMPAAARLLKQHGLKADEIEATGPGGRVLKEDVQRRVDSSSRQTKPTPEKETRRATTDREEEHVPLSPIRRRIASRLVDAQQNAALLTTFNEIDLSAVKQLRAEYRDAFQEEYGVKLGYMSFFIKATIDALERTPQLNAEIRDSSIIYRNYYDIGIAIGNEKGLVVPVLRDAHQKSFAEIELAIDDFSRRANRNELKVDELSGGTFTVTNGGIYGSLLSTPIVNPPQSGVLGMHAIQDRPVAIGGEIVIRPMMYVALTYDHRIVDGREAVTFLRRIKDIIEQPARLLIEI